MCVMSFVVSCVFRRDSILVEEVGEITLHGLDVADDPGRRSLHKHDRWPVGTDKAIGVDIACLSAGASLDLATTRRDVHEVLSEVV